MSPLIGALLSGLAVSLVSFVGFGSLYMARKQLATLLSVIVAFAAGGLLGGAFFHLLPEAVEAFPDLVFPMTLAGIVIFFILDSSIWIYHCHAGHRLHDTKDAHGSCPVKPVGALSLFGDALHNFTDGLVVAPAFLVSVPLGFVTAFAVAMHEIPQEIGDYGILIYSGYSHRKALVANFFVSLTMILGIVAVFVLDERIAGLTGYTIPFAAGGFIYMACTNLLSEIKEEESTTKRAAQFVCFLLGLAVLWATKTWIEG